MILRRREKQTLDALEDLVVFLRDVREERKAVLTITDGWLLYRPNRNLARPLDDARPPTGHACQHRSAHGQADDQDMPNTMGSTRANCEVDR